MTEPIALRYLLHLRSGIGDGQEVAACLVRAYGLLRTLKKILLKNVGFEGAARFAGNDKESLGDVDLAFDRLHLRGIGGIKNVQVGISGDPAESHAEHFRTKTGAAHPEQKNMFESSAPDFFGKIAQLDGVRDLVFRDIQPPQPLALIVAGPKCCVALPETLHLIAGVPIGDVCLHRSGQAFRQRRFQAAHAFCPFCCVLFSTAASSLWKASANSFTPSVVSLAVTSLMEMPALARLSITFCAPAT